MFGSPFIEKLCLLSRLNVSAVVGDCVGVAAALDGEDAADAEAGGAVAVGRGARGGLGRALGRSHARALQRGVSARGARVLLRGTGYKSTCSVVQPNFLRKLKYFICCLRDIFLIFV